MDPDSYHSSMHNCQHYHRREKAMEDNSWGLSETRSERGAHHF